MKRREAKAARPAQRAARLVELALLDARSKREPLSGADSARLERLMRGGMVPSVSEAMAALRSRRSREKTAQWRATEALAAINEDLDRLRQAAGLKLRARWGEANSRMDEIIRLRRLRQARELTPEESERLGALTSIVMKQSSKANRSEILRLKAELEVREDIEIGRAGRADYAAPVLELVDTPEGWTTERAA